MLEDSPILVKSLPEPEDEFGILVCHRSKYRIDQRPRSAESWNKVKRQWDYEYIVPYGAVNHMRFDAQLVQALLAAFPVIRCIHSNRRDF